MANWDEAKSKATELLNEFGFKDPFVDVYKIAEKYGIEIIPMIPDPDVREFSGFLDNNDEKPTIYVNASESVTRQNWTIAHELGHFFLNHKPDQWGIAWRDQTYEEKDEFEQEADYFAACLLIPETMLKKVMNRYKLTRDDFVLLAKMFGVSQKAMKNRLDFLRV